MAMSSTAKSAKWKSQAAEKRAHLGLPQNVSPWAAEMNDTAAFGGAATPRVQAILDLGAAPHLQPTQWQLPFSEKRELLRHVYCDVSQNPCRLTCTNAAGVTGTLTTSALLYSYHRNDLLLPFEHLLLQGHRRSFSVPAHITGQQLRALGGEGIFIPCLGTILWCMYLTKGMP
jgi:hypothetical protein